MKEMTMTADDVMSRTNDTDVCIAGKGYVAKPMPYYESKRFLQVFSKRVSILASKKTGGDDFGFSDILEAAKELLAGDLEILDALPDLCRVIAESYDKTITTEEIHTMSIGEMLDLIVIQTKTEVASSKVASDFFTKLIRESQVMRNLVPILTVLAELQASLTSVSSTSSPSGMESSPPQ
jgi:hypothetical protein